MSPRIAVRVWGPGCTLALTLVFSCSGSEPAGHAPGQALSANAGTHSASGAAATGETGGALLGSAGEATTPAAGGTATGSGGTDPGSSGSAQAGSGETSAECTRDADCGVCRSSAERGCCQCPFVSPQDVCDAVEASQCAAVDCAIRECPEAGTPKCEAGRCVSARASTSG
jgi:hypothetical protein